MPYIGGTIEGKPEIVENRGNYPRGNSVKCLPLVSHNAKARTRVKGVERWRRWEVHDRGKKVSKEGGRIFRGWEWVCVGESHRDVHRYREPTES